MCMTPHDPPASSTLFTGISMQVTITVVTLIQLQGSGKIQGLQEKFIYQCQGITKWSGLWVGRSVLLQHGWRLVIPANASSSSYLHSFDGVIHSGEDDTLDDEYRYWSFGESYPARVSLTTGTREEAVDALHWSYTDPLLAHPQPVPPPFSQDECHKLLTHLNDPSLMSTMRTGMIARILVRSTYGGHLDLESGMASSTGGSMFLAGACARLVAAAILSASVMLMTLPGLNGIARITGLIAIVCSVLNMVTSFIAIIRYKAELTHGTLTSGAEGFVLLSMSRRSVLLSLLLVFLANSVAGFIAQAGSLS
ncbi:hypothetical protein M405DRAFT_837623 [Rhizopogon salebrosus TDB-379]|nr:hypothetical protein M405DRAFT_837623 [Rhizopogon salebrosus TDB-379]